MIKAIIFDRDGTLNKSVNQKTHGYVRKPEELELLPNVKEGLELAKQKDIQCFVFTQQSGIAKRFLGTHVLDNIHTKMSELVGKNAKIEKFYHCPHKQEDRCKCIKPNPQMILDILADYNLHPYEVMVMGDAMRDHKSALSANTPFVFIKSPKHTDEEYEKTGIKAYNDILEAINDVAK